MRRLTAALAIAGALLPVPALAQWSEDPLQRAFLEGARQLEAGNLAQAERIFRELLRMTERPRVKLELARTLYLQGKYAEAKQLFQEVSVERDTPWRVRDNIAHFVRRIEERTGYLKLGVSMVSDSNPRNLAAQKEFSIGDFRVTPTEAPKKVTGLRYSARGWMPVAELGAAGYLAASYTDYPGADLDRLTLDLGAVKNLDAASRLRAKAGLETGTFGGKRLYSFPYAGADAVLAETPTFRALGETKVGKVRFADFSYLDSTYWSGALTTRKTLSRNADLSLRTSVEDSRSQERAYSYRGWELGPGIGMMWPQSAYFANASLSRGSRKYGDVDPLFGKRRSDAKLRLEISAGNKQWRWHDLQFSLVLSTETNHSSIEFYSYRKTCVSLVAE